MSQSALLALRSTLDLPCGPPLHLTATLGTSPQAVGLLFGLAVLAASIVAPPFGALADRVPSATLVAVGTLGAAGAFALIGTARTLPSIGIGLALVAIAGQLVLAPTLTLVAGLAETRTRPPTAPRMSCTPWPMPPGSPRRPAGWFGRRVCGIRGATRAAAAVTTMGGLAAAWWTARAAPTAAASSPTGPGPAAPRDPPASDDPYNPAQGRP